MVSAQILAKTPKETVPRQQIIFRANNYLLNYKLFQLVLLHEYEY